MFNRNLILVLAIALGLNSAVLAMTPDDYCGFHEESGAPGECIAEDSCVRLVSNFGTEDCKKCEPGGCELVDCSECEE